MARDWATRHCVVAVAEEETRAFGRVDMPEIFPPVGRSGRDDSKGGVVG